MLTTNITMQARDIYKKFFLNNVVVAHRGAWKQNNIPQNSIESLREAIRLKCAGTEFDVRMTADSVLVLCHDEDFLGKLVETHTYEELAQTRLANGEVLPKLDKVLMEGMKQTDTRLFLEIKSGSTKKATIKTTLHVLDMVNKYGAHPWVFYIAFDYDAVKKIKELVPTACVAYLNGDVSAEQIKNNSITGVDYHYSIYKKDEDFLNKSKNLGLSLNAWTVNSQDDMDFFLKNNFDYITTDEPELLLQQVNL